MASDAVLRRRTHRVSLPSLVALAVLCFLLGRLSKGGPAHKARAFVSLCVCAVCVRQLLGSTADTALPCPLPCLHRAPKHQRRAPQDPAYLAGFADASHQVALQEAHLVRRQSLERLAGGNATTTSNSDGLVDEAPVVGTNATTAAAPLLPQPLPAGENGNSFVSFVPYQVLSWEPRAVYFPGFLDKQRCEHIIRLASRHLAPSGLALRKGESEANTGDIRTSQGTFLSRRDDGAGVLDYLEKRIADATMLPQRHGEPFNVLRYEEGQKYDSHYDTFDPESYGPQPSQRVASFLVYLNDWNSGGETVFPLEGPAGLKRLAGIDYKSCAEGLKVKPLKAGDALLFYSVNPEGTFDKHALHGGCPVHEGTKWVATKWIRDKAF